MNNRKNFYDSATCLLEFFSMNDELREIRLCKKYCLPALWNILFYYIIFLVFIISIIILCLSFMANKRVNKERSFMYKSPSNK